MKWACGVTTVQTRSGSTLPRTLASIKAAGFPNPIIFVDDPYAPSDDEYQRVYRGPRIRTFGNWLLGLMEVYIREPQADRYVMFQDDVVMYRNLRDYLEQVPMESKCYWNLLTFPENEIRELRTFKNMSVEQVERFTRQNTPVPDQVQKIYDRFLPESSDYVGFYPSGQNGKGAVALAFSNAGVMELLKSDVMITKPKEVNGYQCLDGTILTAFFRLGWTEYVHNPSLTFHIGNVSSMSHGTYPDAGTFRGEAFDALYLFNKTEAPVTTPALDTFNRSFNTTGRIYDMLSRIGIQPERVDAWLARACCGDQQRRINRLQWWIDEVLVQGREAEAKARFEEFLDE